MRKSHEKCHIGIFLLSKEVKISLNEKGKAYTYHGTLKQRRKIKIKINREICYLSMTTNQNHN